MQFWHVTFDVVQEIYIKFHYEKLHDLDLQPEHEVITNLTNKYFLTAVAKQCFCIPADSEVQFGNSTYQTCRDILLRSDYSLISSDSCRVHFHIGNTVREVTANPFQLGKIINNKIQLKCPGKAPFTFSVDAADFAAKITQCRFGSTDVMYTLYNTFPDNPTLIECSNAIIWKKSDALQTFHKWRILSQKDYFVELSFLSGFALENICSKAFPLAARLGDINMIAYLESLDFDLTRYYDSAIMSAIQAGHIAVIRHLMTKNYDFESQYAKYLTVAKDSGQTEVISYFENHALNQRLHSHQILDEMDKMQQCLYKVQQLLKSTQPKV